MLKIYLARHGQDEDNFNGILNGRRDKPLTPLGRRQAFELSENIKKKGIQFVKVYSSPLKRTFETAQIITKNLGINPPEKWDLIIERDFGIMTGQPHTKIKEMCSPKIIETDTVTYFLSPQGAETFPDLIKRSKKILKTVKENHPDGNILLVTHGDIGKMIFTTYYQLDWKKVLKMFHLGNSDLILLAQNTTPAKAYIFKNNQVNL